jgi:hypothetical protein
MLVVLVIRDPPRLKSIFRGSLVTSLSFTIAFVFGEAQQTYSTQVQWVAILLASIIVVSTNCTGLTILLGVFNDNKPNPVLDTMVTIVALPATIGLLLTAIFKKSTWIAVRCTRVQYSTETHIVRVFSYTTLTLLWITGLLSFIRILYFRYSNSQNTTQKRMWFCIVSVCWLLTFVFTVGTAEFLMGAAFYEEKDGGSIALRASTWGLGQVMAVIMMASFIWEIANFYSERYQVCLHNFRVRFIRCDCFHSRHTIPDRRQDVEMGLQPHDVVDTDRDVSTDQLDNSERNVDARNANSEPNPIV